VELLTNMNEYVTIEGNKNKEGSSEVKTESSAKGMYIPTQLLHRRMLINGEKFPDLGFHGLMYN
jgi:hypothetical protein